MKKYKVPFGAALLFAGVLLVSNAQAVQTFNVTPTYNPDLYGAGMPGWESGDIPLDLGTTIGGTALELQLTLSQDITLASLGTGYNYGFGMGGLDPEIATDGDAFNFAIELLENGTLITPDFAYDFAHPWTFGFDETNPFSFPVNNLWTGSSTTALAGSLTFNQIYIQVTNSNDGGEAVTDFAVNLGVNGLIVPPPGVPDTCNTLALLSSGFLATLGFGWRKMRALRSHA